MMRGGYASREDRVSRAALCTLLTLALTAALQPSTAGDDAGYAGRPLLEVLRELQERGLNLVFSSAVVSSDVRVSVEPTSTDPQAMLDEILPPLGLRTGSGPGGSILILPAERPRATFITEVVVTPNRQSLIRQEQAASRTLTGEDAVLAPTIGGDITRVVELLPGVAAQDNSAAFNVRGGVAQDVSLVLDGLELYDPFHLLTFHSPFSVIDSNVVDRIDFLGGGFTADLGDRHGGFVEFSTFEPGGPGLGELELGTQNSRVSYRAPMASKPGSWLLSARGWYPEALIDTTELGEGENLDPRFGDLYVKAAFNVGSRHVLSSHGLAAYDRLKYQETGELVNESVDAVTRNAYVWLRALSAWSKRWTSETILSGGRIERTRDGVSSGDGEAIVDDRRIVDFFGLKHDATWRISETQMLKAGADLRWLDADYDYSETLTADPAGSSSIRLDPNGTSIGIYAAHRARVLATLATEIGLRWDRQTYTDDDQLSPRFNAVWQAGVRSELRLAWGRFHQSQRIHELHVEDAETTFSPAETSDQAELSFRHAFRNGLRVRFDAYYRKLNELRTRYENLFEPIELFPETSPDRVAISPDEARLQGIELLVRGDAARPLTWWASYALSSADDLVDGRHVPRSWDQTHTGKFLVGYRRDDRWSVALSGSAHTGWPTTPLSAEASMLPDGSTEYEAIPGARNSDRYSDYVRVDFKARHAFALDRGRLWLTLEVVNLLDRQNVCCLNEVEFEPQDDGSVDVIRKFDHWLGVTPTFSVLWEF